MANLPRAGFSFVDYDGEVSKMGYGIPPASALNIAGIITGVGALRAAIQGISLGTITTEYGQMYNTKLSQVRPSNVNAQRERKWLVRYYDDTPHLDLIGAVPNPNYLEVDSVEIPCADLSLLAAGSDRANPANAAVIAFVSEFEANARTKFGTALKVLEIIAVGRNL